MDLFCMERISVTSGCHGCKIFECHRSILTDTANNGRKVRPTVFPECNYVRESHTCLFFRFFTPVISSRTTVTWNPEFSATMAAWRNDVSSLFRSSECCQWNEVDSWLWCTDNSYIKDRNSSSKSRWVGAKYWRVKFLQQLFTKIEKNNCF